MNNHVLKLRQIAVNQINASLKLTEELAKIEEDNKVGKVAPAEYVNRKNIISLAITEPKEALRAIKDIQDNYHKEVDDWEMPSGAKVHDDIKVLSGLIPLNQTDLERLEDKHFDNPTMVKAITKYAVDNNVGFVSKAITGAQKKAAFDHMVAYANGAITHSDGAQAAIMKDDENFTKIYQAVIDGKPIYQ